MYPSAQQLPALIDLYNEAASVPNSADGGIWDSLLSLIGDLVQKLLNTAIGAGGQTVNDLINGVKNKISSIVGDVTNAVNNVKTALNGTIKTAVDTIENWVTLAVGKVSTTLDGIVGKLSTMVNDVVTGVSDKISEIANGISDAISGAINGLIDKIDGIINTLENIANNIKNAISEAIRNIGDFIVSSVNDAIATVTSIINDVIENTKTYISNVYNDISKFITNVIDTAKEWVSNAYNTVKDAITNTINTLKDAYESTKETVVDWIKNALAMVNDFKERLSNFFWARMSEIGEWIAKVVIPKFGDIVTTAQQITTLLKGVWGFVEKGDYQGAFNALDSIFKEGGIPAPSNMLIHILSAIAYIYETVKIQFIPMQVAAQKNAEITLALEAISTNEAATAVFKGIWGESDFIRNASLSGVSSERAKVSLEANRNIVSPGQAQQLFLRGEIDEKEHDHILSSYGFNDTHIKEIKSLYAVIPSLNDIISMAVKEAFTPEIAEKFGQYQDLPEAFVSWAGKQGLSEEWSKRYWAAHWDLPSPNMGFEMFQRGIIEKDELELLLKALDIMPFWREKLIQLSYNPPTRVDIRRMYKIGMLTEEQVYQFHLAIGYSPDNARMLTEFTKRYSAPEDQSQADEFSNLARSVYSNAYKKRIISLDEYKTFLSELKYQSGDIDLLVSLDDYAMIEQDSLFDINDYRKGYYKLITQAYNRGLFNRSDAKMLMGDLGMTEEYSELELSLIDYNRELTIKDTLLGQLHDQYVSFIIDEIDLHTVLDTFGFYSAEIDRLIEEWNIERSFRTKKPTMSEIKSFYKAGLMDIDTALDEIRGLGYHEKYIDLFAQTLSKGSN